MLPEQYHFRQFLLYVFVLLIPFFMLWTAGSDRIQVPAIGLVHIILTGWFPDIVSGVFIDGANAVLMTEFGEQGGRPIPLAEAVADNQLGFRVNPRILTYSLPFYTALYFATPRESYLVNYLLGLLLLYGVAVFGLLCLCLKELMVNLGPLFFNQQGVFVPGPNLIGILYQFNVLILPTLGPTVLWLWQGRDTPLLRDLLGAVESART